MLNEECFCPACTTLIKKKFTNHIKFIEFRKYLCKKCQGVYEDYISNWRHRKLAFEREVREYNDDEYPSVG
jgi:hypothetical protein